MTVAARTVVTRAQVEDFLYHEAALLDEWRLNEWEALLADDASLLRAAQRPTSRATIAPRCSSSPTTASASASA